MGCRNTFEFRREELPEPEPEPEPESPNPIRTPNPNPHPNPDPNPDPNPNPEQELGLLRQVPAAQVTDDDVFESYRNMGEVPRG